MKVKEQLEQLREMNLEELKDQADALKESLFRLNFRQALGETDAGKNYKRDRKTLARIQTLMNQTKVKAQ